jgi:outer membrane protein OmpA-like peptidoglycan-associated protein
MYRHRTVIRSRRPTRLWLTRIMFISVILFCLHAGLQAQEIQRLQPTWWFGVAGAANLNFYSGTTQMLNSAITAPTAFHKGFGAGVYLAPMIEYRPNANWGAILQVGYDERRGSFNDVKAPCGSTSTLSTTISYVSIEPSLRWAPFSERLYIFGGPRIGFNWAPNIQKPSTSDEKTFVFTVEGKYASVAEFSGMRSPVLSGQIGIGYDFALASTSGGRQFNLSPFVSYQPYFGQEPRSEPSLGKSWGVSTLRLGVAIKFGTEAEASPAAPVVEREVKFSVRAPKAVPARRRIRETFPLLKKVFFEAGSTEIPDRYAMLTKIQAAIFKEEQLQEIQPKSVSGRSLRQMSVYYDILNILGDRMRRSPGSTISLSGASEDGPEQGKERAESIKRYLTDIFGIDGSRITTEGRDKPEDPSIVPGATKELALLRAEDRRVDIESTSPEMMIQVGGGPHNMLKPVQIVSVVEDPLDSQVLFYAVGAKEAFASWTLEITDDQGKVQRFGPSTRDRENISGNTILGDRSKGDFKVVLLAQTKSGKFVRKESSVQLVRRVEPIKEAVRFSVLFGFGQSETVARYEKFLTDVVTPLIPDSSNVVIRGHTDIVGTEAYNDSLSAQRVEDVQNIIEGAISNTSKHGIIFGTFGFGEDLQYAPFDNYFPEERFYNRTVIIDIVPEK